jgi:hypothetical protein
LSISKKEIRMRKLAVLPLLAALALAGLMATPPPAAASDVGCSALTVVNTDGNYQTLIRMCEDWSGDHQSIRARLGVEYRYGGVRASVGRGDWNNVWLAYQGAYVRSDDLGVVPPSGFTDGGVLYGGWFNDPGVCGLHGSSYAIELGNKVRYSNGHNPTLASLSSATLNWDYDSCS